MTDSNTTPTAPINVTRSTDDVGSHQAPRRRMHPLLVGLLAVLGAGLIAGAGVVGGSIWAVNNVKIPAPVTVETESSNTLVIESVQRTEQVALVSLGIQGIAERKENTTFLGFDVPGSERALYMQYNFTAKLGMDGTKVAIEHLEDGSYLISIPEFEFIGHDDIEFKLVTENNGVLSFVTPEIDELEMANTVLNDEAQQAYLDENAALLREQAEEFYRGIITAIEPDAVITFSYEAGN